jgi:hypothetical protein
LKYRITNVDLEVRRKEEHKEYKGSETEKIEMENSKKLFLLYTR